MITMSKSDLDASSPNFHGAREPKFLQTVDSPNQSCSQAGTCVLWEDPESSLSSPLGTNLDALT